MNGTAARASGNADPDTVHRDRDRVRRALQGEHDLDDRNATILRNLFGVDDDWPLTRHEVAGLLRISATTVTNRAKHALAALGLGHLRPPLPGSRTYRSRADGTPYYNDVVSYVNVVWWRTARDTWTDGEIELTWRSLHDGDAPLRDRRRDRDMVPSSVLAHKGLADRDPLSLAIIAHLVEGKYEALHAGHARRHALRDLDRLLSDEPAGHTVVDLVAGAVGVTPDIVRRALGRGTPHLWEHRHKGPATRGDAGNETAVASFAALREHYHTASSADDAVVYRWDWNPAPTAGPSDELVVHALSTGTGSVFTVSCPIGRDEEPQVLHWLRGPQVLGRLRDLYSPLLDS